MIENNNQRKNKLVIIGTLVLILLVGGLTYAFYNYTSTGDSNVLKTGNITFRTTENGIINLENAFPMNQEELADNENISNVSINITGKNTYNDGMEYLVSAVDISNITVGTGAQEKAVPVSLDVSVVGENVHNHPLGYEDDYYFVNRGSDINIYEDLANGVITSDGNILVGYIAPNQEINSTIKIIGYFNEDLLVISDTYGENGDTPLDFGEGKTVLTTDEWEELETSPISFRIRVEAREGLWVEDPNNSVDFSANKYWEKTTKILRYSYQNRISPNELIEVNAGDTITYKQNSTYSFAYFDADYDLDHDYILLKYDSSWLYTGAEDVTIEYDKHTYVAINCKRIDGSDMTSSDIEAVKDLIVINKSSVNQTLTTSDLSFTSYRTNNDFIMINSTNNVIGVTSPLYFPAGSELTIKQNNKYLYEYYLLHYDENDGYYYFIDDVSWSNTENGNVTITSSANYYIIIQFRKQNWEEITSKDLIQVKNLTLFNRSSEELVINPFLNNRRWKQSGYFLHDGSETRVSNVEIINISAGGSITFKQNTSYVFGYFDMNVDEINDYYFSKVDSGWLTNVSSQDIVVNFEEDAKIAINVRKVDYGSMSNADIEAIKDLIIVQENSTAVGETLDTSAYSKSSYHGSGQYILDYYDINTNVVGPTEPIFLTEGSTITIKQNSEYVYEYFFATYNEDDGYYHYDSYSGWNDDCSTGDVTITAPSDIYIALDIRHQSWYAFSLQDLAEVESLVIYPSYVYGMQSDVISNQDLLGSSVKIDTYNGYKIVTIPQELSNGKRIIPHVALTSSTVGGSDTMSALTYAGLNDYSVVINGGLFNTQTRVPQGQTIIEGASITNSPMTDDMGAEISDEECYPLTFNRYGIFSTPYTRTVDTSTMIDDGVVGAVTGWITLIENGARKYENYSTVEIVHKGSASRQVIGQYEDGDYFIFTTTSQDKTGMNYDSIANVLLALDKTVYFAYSLDGGGSTETVINGEQINTIYEGTYGRKVPTVIYFDVQ